MKFTKEDYILDEWDFALIYYMKHHQSPHIGDIMKIWAKRTGLMPEDCKRYISSIVEHYLNLIQAYDLKTMAEMAKNMEPKYRWDNQKEIWQYALSVWDKKDYWQRYLAEVCSTFMLAKILDLPQYWEYYEKTHWVDFKKKFGIVYN